MQKAKRNRRAVSIGSAPVPTPVFVAASADGFSTTQYTIYPTTMGENQLGIPFGEFNLTGVETQIVVIDESDGREIPIASITITDDGGQSFMTLLFSETLVPGNYLLVNKSFDPASRGAKGEWLTPFQFPFSLS